MPKIKCRNAAYCAAFTDRAEERHICLLSASWNSTFCHKACWILQIQWRKNKFCEIWHLSHWSAHKRSSVVLATGNLNPSILHFYSLVVECAVKPNLTYHNPTKFSRRESNRNCLPLTTSEWQHQASIPSSNASLPSQVPTRPNPA